MNRIELVASRAGDLPTLPQVATRILDRVRDPSATAAELGGIVSRDQAMVSKLLRIANSAMYGLRYPVTDIRRAIVVIGFTTLRSTVMAAATQALFQSRHSRLKEYLLWEHSLAVAIGARLIAGDLRYPAPEEAFVAGLLHDVGKIVLDQNLKEEYQPVIEAVFNEGITFVEAEAEMLGFDHTDVGAHVVAKWNLAPQLQEAVQLHHRPAEAQTDLTFCTIVSLANSLAVKLEIGPERQADMDVAALDSARHLQLDAERLEQIAERISGRLDEERSNFGETSAEAG